MKIREFKTWNRLLNELRAMHREASADDVPMRDRVKVWLEAFEEDFAHDDEAALMSLFLMSQVIDEELELAHGPKNVHANRKVHQACVRQMRRHVATCPECANLTKAKYVALQMKNALVIAEKAEPQIGVPSTEMNLAFYLRALCEVVDDGKVWGPACSVDD